MKIILLMLFCAVQAHALVPEDYFRSSLSDETLDYAPIRPFKMAEDDTKDEVSNWYQLLRQYTDMHNVMKALKEYEAVCEEIIEADQLIDKATENQSYITCLNREKLKADTGKEWDVLVNEYLNKPSNKLQPVAQYLTNLKSSLQNIRDLKANKDGFEKIETDFEDVAGAAETIKNLYVAWTKGTPGDPMDEKEKYWANWVMANEVLQKYYPPKKPDDVDFFERNPVAITALGLDLTDPYKNVPILERTKYLADKSGKDKFYNIPKVWEVYAAIWPQNVFCPNGINKGPVFIPCDPNVEGSCAMVSNLRGNGEWDRYLKKPTLTAKTETVDETDADGNPVLDAAGNPKTKTVPTCEADAVDIPWELETKNSDGEIWDPKIFHNRFEDYDRTQISLFRAYENKRNLMRIAKVMTQNIKTNLEFLDKNAFMQRPDDSSSTTGSSSSSGAGTPSKYENMGCGEELSQELEELALWQDKVKETLKDYDIPDELKDQFEDLTDPAYQGVLFGYQLKRNNEALKNINDFIAALPNATEVFGEDDSIYLENVENIWGPEIYGQDILTNCK